MLGVLINLVIAGGVLHEQTSGLQIKPVRNDLALTGYISAPLRGRAAGAGPSWD